MQNQVINRGNKSQNYNLSAPIGGINARDSLDAMSETDAIVMDNFYPAETKVCLRGGYRSYALNDEEINIETLIEFRHQTYNKLFACGMGKIWDISSSSNIELVSSGHSSDYWQYAQFKERIIACNGLNYPLTYYQTSSGNWEWQNASFNGVGLESNLLINVTVSKERLFFVESNSLRCWFSAGVGEVQGELKCLDFSSLVTKGGKLQAIASWTQDGGKGIDDLTVFITSEGEALVYSGNDPSSADDWSLRGKYYISKPIGYRCTLQYQGDLVIISEDGYIPLSKALPLNQSNLSDVAFSDKIRGMVLDRVKSNRNLKGWQGILYSRGGYCLFNVPYRGQYEQHVINLSSGAWCRFTNIRSSCWGMLNGRLYFGSDTGVYLFDEGYSDNGMHIMGKVCQAYSNFGSNNLKKIQMINPRTKSSTKYALTIYTNMDFDDKERSFIENIGSVGLTKWGSKWSSIKNPTGTKWATLKGNIRGQWICNCASGFKASIVFKTKTRGNIIEWYNTGVRYEQGAGIL